MGVIGIPGGDAGNWPQRYKYKPQGASQAYQDIGHRNLPRAIADWDEDFEGQPYEYVLNAASVDLPTTGATSFLKIIPRSGYITAVEFTSVAALTADGTNYLTFTMLNRLASGSGSAAMLLVASTLNNTNSGGTPAGTTITAKARRSLDLIATAAALWVNEGDVIEFVATATGTLANAVTGATFELKIASAPSRTYPRVTRTAGTPFCAPVANVANGEVKALLSATNEAQVAGFDWKDNLLVPATRAGLFQALVKFPTAITTAQRAILGFGSAYNATFNSVQYNCWFRLQASMVLQVEADDDTTDVTITSTGITLTADTYYLFTVDMRDPSAVRFYLDDNLLATLTTLTWTAAMLLQPCCWLQKDSGTGTPALTMDRRRTQWSRY